jgi:hypothetical protein
LARARRPGLPLLFVTGFIDREALGTADEGLVIRKPFAQEELAGKVRMALLSAGTGHVGQKHG